jgi:hypothetical protein
VTGSCRTSPAAACSATSPPRRPGNRTPGIEFAITGHWTAKAEYLYVDLGKFNCCLNCGAASDNVAFNTNIMRAGVNYCF